METTFYSTFASAAFALLGLWWVVVAERRREWTTVSYRGRQAYTVSLYFMLAGIMSLISLVSAGHTAVWRLAFGIAGAVGTMETGASLLRARTEPASEGRVHGLLWVTLPLYIVVVAVAVHPTLASNIGIHLKPLETEAIALSLLVFLGVNYAWLLFMEPPHTTAENKDGG
jgi:hypothetical protein